MTRGTTAAFVALLLVSMTLAACAATPSPTTSTTPIPPTPTAVPTASPTAAPTPTPGPTLTPDPRPLFALENVPYLCIGLAATTPGGVSYQGLNGLLTDYRIEDGRSLHIEWKTLNTLYNTYSIIRSYRIEGSAEVVAKPDASPIDDAAIVWNGVPVKLGKGATYEGFVNAMGAPTKDETNDTNEGQERILTYPDATVYLELVGVPYALMDTDSLRFVTPRGLRIGLTVAQMLPLFATGDFILEVKDEGGGIQSINVYDSEGYIAYVHFSGGTVSRVEFG